MGEWKPPGERPKGEKKKGETPVPKVLSTGKVVKNRQLGGGVNETRLVGIKGPEGEIVNGVFKPIPGERRGLRKGLKSIMKEKAFPQAKREVAASGLAEQLGLEEYVPPTVMRKVSGETGSVQLFVENAETGAFYNVFTGRKLTPTERTECTIFDFLIGNTDRHGSNWMRSKATGKPFLIDNGLSFPVTRKEVAYGMAYSPEGLSEWRCGFVTGKSYKIPKKVIRKWRKRLEGFDVKAFVKKYKIPKGINSPADTFEIRVEALKKIFLLDEIEVSQEFWDFVNEAQDVSDFGIFGRVFE